MSLQVWLPLNGNLNNYGASGLVPVQSTAPTYVNGKIGKAMSTGALYLPAAGVAKFYNGNKMSFAFWIYPTTDASAGTPIIGQSSTAAGDNRMFSIYQYDHAVDIHLSWQGETSNSTFLAVVWQNVLTVSTWNHVAITYDGTTAKLYVNGVYKNSATGTSTRTNFSYNVPIPNSSQRYLNDLRIYDHVLSIKEIRELSKALVIHYAMNDQYALGAINKYSGNRTEGDTSGSSWTKTKLANERGYNFKGTRTGDGNNSWWSFIFPTFTFTAGKRYYYSLKCRCNKFTNAHLYLRAARSSNDWVTSSVVIANPSLSDGKWHEYSVSQVINSTYDRSGTTVTCAPVLEAYTSNMNGSGTVYDMDFDIKDIQVVESDVYIPYIQNDYADGKVYDIAGYARNGSIGGTSGNLKLINDSPRYDGCYDFTNPAYILYSGLPTNMYYATYTFWVYFKSFTAYGGYHMQENNPAGGNVPWFSANTESASLWCYFGGNSPNYTKAGSGDLATNTWYHVAYVWNNGVAQWYLNGAKYGNAVTYTGKTYIPNGVNATIGDSYTGTSWNGTPFNGRISDFRIYATALSADDILELYRANAEIDTNGRVYSSDFTEV